MPEKQQLPKLHFDVATALSKGRRDYQEDALASDFPVGGDIGFAVLSDGMGGHAAGDVASKIVVTEVFSELKFQSNADSELIEHTGDILREAALAANECIKAHTRNNPDTAGMGATLLAPVIMGNHLHWISVGDSPLYLYRGKELRQLNEDHSLAPQIDLMMNAGLIEKEVARTHPDRSCLTSVIVGNPIEKIDCPDEPLELQDGDIIVAASDGLQTLSDEDIAEILGQDDSLASTRLARELLSTVEAYDDETQDNTAVCIIRAIDLERAEKSERRRSRKRRKTAEIVPMPKPKMRGVANDTAKNADVAKT